MLLLVFFFGITWEIQPHHRYTTLFSSELETTLGIPVPVDTPDTKNNSEDQTVSRNQLATTVCTRGPVCRHLGVNWSLKPVRIIRVLSVGAVVFCYHFILHGVPA